MKKYELHNNGKNIGVLKTFGKALRRLDPKYKIAGTLLVGGGIAISLLSCGKHEEQLDDSSRASLSETVEESLYDSNDLFRSDLFVYYCDNGDIYFCTSKYLQDNNLVPLDTIDTRYEFIEDFNYKLMNGYREEHPEKDFSEYDSKYQFFRQVYEEYIDGNQQEAFFQKNYLLQVEEELIQVIHGLGTYSYSPEAIEFDKYIDMTYPQEDKKHTIEYYVEKDQTLSEIANSYADNPTEYKEIIDEIMANPNNNVQNPDLIYAGTTLELPRVDLGDAQDTFGYTFNGSTDYPDNFRPADELKQRYEWINSHMNDIYVLSGDETSKENKENLLEAIGKWKEAYDEYLQGNVDMDVVLYDSRSICDTIYLLTGQKYEIIFPEVGRNR